MIFPTKTWWLKKSSWGLKESCWFRQHIWWFRHPSKPTGASQNGASTKSSGIDQQEYGILDIQWLGGRGSELWVFIFPVQWGAKKGATLRVSQPHTGCQTHDGFSKSLSTGSATGHCWNVCCYLLLMQIRILRAQKHTKLKQNSGGWFCRMIKMAHHQYENRGMKGNDGSLPPKRQALTDQRDDMKVLNVICFVLVAKA